MQFLPARLVVRPPQPSADDATKDIRSTLTISTAEARSGTSRMITLPGGHKVKVSVPAGAYDGQVIRLRNPGESSNPVGELILTIAITFSEVAQQPSNGVTAEQTVLSSQNGVQQPSGPVPLSDRDLPTVASSHPNLRAPEVQQQPPTQKRRRTSPAMIISIISGLIILLLLGGAVFFYSTSSNHQTSTNVLTQSQTATAVAQTSKHTPTVQISPTPTPPGMYIAGTYNGSMFDATTNQTSNISVKIVQSQGSGVLNGTFTNTSTSQNYPLAGTVDLRGQLPFYSATTCRSVTALLLRQC